MSISLCYIYLLRLGLLMWLLKDRKRKKNYEKELCGYGKHRKYINKKTLYLIQTNHIFNCVIFCWVNNYCHL